MEDIKLRLFQSGLDVLFAACGIAAHTFQGGVGGCALQVFFFVTVGAAQRGIVAFGSQSPTWAGCYTLRAISADIRSHIRITIVATHQWGIRQEQSYRHLRTISTCQKPTVATGNALARTSHHVGQSLVGQWVGREDMGLVALHLQFFSKSHQIAQSDELGTRTDAVASIARSRLLGPEEWLGNCLPQNNGAMHLELNAIKQLLLLRCQQININCAKDGYMLRESRLLQQEGQLATVLSLGIFSEVRLRNLTFHIFSRTRCSPNLLHTEASFFLSVHFTVPCGHTRRQRSQSCFT